MEFTETEIKMFREAEEIQALYPWGDDIACGVIQNCLYLSADEPSKSILLDAGGNLWFEGGFVDDLPRLPKATIHIWLPTQEQLQGMVLILRRGCKRLLLPWRSSARLLSVALSRYLVQ